jgi:cytochrome c peroxidase
MSLRSHGLTFALLAVSSVAGITACGEGADTGPAHVSVQQHVGTGAPTVVARIGSRAPAVAAAVPAETDINPRLLKRFAPLPVATPSDAEKVDLGRKLFFDPRLSKSGDVACNSCHALDQYGVDNKRRSSGIGGQLGGRNAPTVYNAFGHFAQFWDGRATDVEAQALGPILNPKEMGMPNGPEVVRSLSKVPGYVDLFKKAFPDSKEPLSFANVGAAIGTFERGLTTPGRWDKFLKGDSGALTDAEKKGLRTFLNSGCMVCHTGAYLGGSMYERVGVVEPWPNQEDRGRQGVTNVNGDSMMFKVPSLRNVARTAPYFHDGSAETLEDAVRTMGRYQLGLDLGDDEVGSIVTWLRSLTGELPAAYIEKPELPK